MKCDYGCNQDSRITFKNGKNCCSKNVSMCPAVITVISSKLKNAYKIGSKKNPAHTKNICEFCKEFIGITNFKAHQRTCYLNPQNLKLCPICSTPIKDYKRADTCSQKCAKEFFKDIRVESSKKNRNLTYVTICFSNHEKKCIVCGEDKIVGVHHYDENHKNNLPENLIPLCPTHQTYMHSKFKNLINDKVELYRNTWIESKKLMGL
jgi:predicted nucleic acid-binding Zn ribbon protein